jgi:hypothetical protein
MGMTKILVSCGCLVCSHCVVQNFGKNASMFGLEPTDLIRILDFGVLDNIYLLAKFENKKDTIKEKKL